jgi:phytoene dehydrogenase-like protein
VPGGNVWRRRRALSAWDVVRHAYEDPHIQAFALWVVAQSATSVDLPGSGLQAVSGPAGRQARSWPIPLGGSAALTQALVAVIEEHGGAVLCDQMVTSLVVDGDRCLGVQTARGDRFDGRDAVVSSIHVRHLLDMAPREVWDDAFVYGVETLDLGLSLSVVHVAATQPPLFAGCEDEEVAVASGVAPWPEDTVRIGRDHRDGVPTTESANILVATPSVVDPTRAPAGHHTVKFVTSASPASPPGTSSWDEARAAHAERLTATVRRAAPNLTDGVIVDRRVLTPADIERWNPHMIKGTAHGGDRGLPFSGALRPAAGWAQHRMPLRGLYQTGGTTHPGGSITGLPGRNAALVVMDDLGIDIAGVVHR